MARVVVRSFLRTPNISSSIVDAFEKTADESRRRCSKGQQCSHTLWPPIPAPSNLTPLSLLRSDHPWRVRISALRTVTIDEPKTGPVSNWLARILHRLLRHPRGRPDRAGVVGGILFAPLVFALCTAGRVAASSAVPGDWRNSLPQSSMSPRSRWLRARGGVRVFSLPIRFGRRGREIRTAHRHHPQYRTGKSARISRVVCRRESRCHPVAGCIGRTSSHSLGATQTCVRDRLLSSCC